MASPIRILSFQQTRLFTVPNTSWVHSSVLISWFTFSRFNNVFWAPIYYARQCAGNLGILEHCLPLHLLILSNWNSTHFPSLSSKPHHLPEDSPDPLAKNDLCFPLTSYYTFSSQIKWLASLWPHRTFLSLLVLVHATCFSFTPFQLHFTPQLIHLFRLRNFLWFTQSGLDIQIYDHPMLRIGPLYLCGCGRSQTESLTPVSHVSSPQRVLHKCLLNDWMLNTWQMH